MEILKDAIGCEGGFVWMYDRDNSRNAIIASGTGCDVTGITIGKDQGVVGHVMETAETLTVHNPIADDSPLYGSDDATGMIVKNQLVSPLKIPGGEAFGCIQLVNKNEGNFDREDIRLCESMAAMAAMDIEDKGYKVSLPAKRKPMIVLRNVIKEFPSGDSVIRVLKGIDLDIYEKEFLVILGESGCGKTTMMNIIGGMDAMTDGSLLIDGKDFSHPSDRDLTEFRRNYIGFIFQSYNLMPNLSALENLQFIAEISKNPIPPEKALKQVGLSDRAGNFPSQMSGGQQQRVSIARALTKNPKLILADEPTAALDYETSIEVLSIVEDIVKNGGKTVVMITHNPEIAKMANRVVKLRSGLISNIRINARPLSARELVW
ncbi:MAG: ATP-binding cassette domain-containing protein [Eubacterium sp.]|nr:ATP-binding cassette domain-containing protein [Eubacterium sp.]